MNSIKEFVELAKAKPSTINFASWGRSSTPYLYVELFKTKERVLFSDIPYKSAVNAWQAVFTGEADATIYGVRAGLPQMKAGKVKLLAVNTDARLPDLPDTPTFTEAGLQPSLIVWFALFAPSATPKEIVQRINAEVVKGLYNNPELRERYLSSQGMLIYGPAGGSTDAASEFVRSQSSMYGELMRAANVSPQ